MFNGIMVNRDNDESDMDEGWWNSILSDEENYHVVEDEEAANDHTLVHCKFIDWDKVRAIYEKDEIVRLEVNGFNRGGLLVEGEGIHGFVPISHLTEINNTLEDEEQKKEYLASHMGNSIRLKIIECKPELDRIVFSERAALAGEGQRNELFNYLEPGLRIKGKITNITDFGVFVDLGGIEGLVHVSELSWGRVQHPKKIVEVGQEIDTIVLQVNEECARVALSIKQLYPNPWKIINRTYQIGDEVDAEITSLAGFGAFARLQEGIEGLIHISSIKSKFINEDINSLLTPGQKVRVEILNIDADKRRLGLGLVNIE